ncbi:hypothetical protein NliqN6_6209 [Naganishia liquefaciens]|uniref:Zn(2)-C6 fungal-type domain-containing protein n=1 Tax=Naganishia liquefaciens TaxID=104408 RepID=A0A8H3TZ85_9TREE|nr:hypothetical protein NliqN6_6209 [Naganishia liquefaciens]
MDSQWQASSVNAVPPTDSTISGQRHPAQPSTNVTPVSPTRQLSGNAQADNRPIAIQPSPIQPHFASVPGSEGNTPQLQQIQSHSEAQKPSATKMGMHGSMDSNRWNHQWTTLPLSIMPQKLNSETDSTLHPNHQALLQVQKALNSHAGTPVNQPSLNSLVPPRGRAGQNASNSGPLDSTMFVNINSDRQKTDNRDHALATPQSYNSGSRINLGWASAGTQGNSWQPSSTNVSPVVAGTSRSGGQTVPPQSQNLSGATSTVSSRHNSPTANLNPGNDNPSWPDVNTAASQLQQQRSTISQGGLLGMMANHPASGQPTPLGSPALTQQPLLGTNQSMQQYQNHHELHPDINMMQAMGQNMIKNGPGTDFARRQSGTGTLDHSSGSNTPLTAGALPGNNLAFPGLSNQYNMTAPGMGMAPRPFNMAHPHIPDGHFTQSYPYGGAMQNTMPGTGMTSPINPLGLAFGQQHPGAMTYQQGLGQPTSGAALYSQGVQQIPQSIMTGHNLDAPVHAGPHGSNHQHQPHVHSSLSNKVNFAISPELPLQPKLEPQDIEMAPMTSTRTGSKSAPTSRQGTPLLVAVGLDEDTHKTKRSSSGSRKMDKERGEPVYSYSGAQPTAGAKMGLDPDGKTLSLTSDAHADEGDQDTREDRLDHRKRKRNRTIQSCLPCHQNKRKCDRKKPCSRCKTLGLTGSCVYEVDHSRDEDDPDQTENDHLRSRIAELEQVVRELRQKGSGRATSSVVPSSYDVEPANKKRKLIIDRFAKFRYDEAMRSANAPSGVDQNTSTSFPIHPGRPHISVIDAHRKGPTSSRKTSIPEDPSHTGSRRESLVDDGWKSDSRRSSKEQIEEPYIASVKGEGDSLIGDSAGRKAYVGVPGGRQLLKSLQNLTESKSNHPTEGEPMQVLEDVAFTGVFSDLRKTFPFTTIWSHDNFAAEIIGLLPNRKQSELVWDAFESEIAAFFAAWHLPTLRADYLEFFDATHEEKMVTPLGTLSVMLMICALGVMMRASQTEIFGEAAGVSSPEEAEADLTCSRLQSELFLSGAYQALRLCSFLSSPTVSTVTAGIMIGIYLLNSERASDFWPELGSTIRQAICMGLHIDPMQLYPGMSQKDAEVRRRMWWTIAGLDALVCLSLGRPSAISYYSTKLPQDIPDDQLGDVPPEQAKLSPVSNETTTFTYHAAYFALTIPSLDILERVFPKKRSYGRDGVLGWFAPLVKDEADEDPPDLGASTYEDALRLDDDIVSWYKLVPRKMRFNADEDDTARLLEQRTYWQIQQTLALCVKTNMIRLILHRPYLRMDPAAYPHSAKICFDAAHAILCAFKAMVGTKCSIVWSWWTMSLRAFHSAAVCAFLAMREPNDPHASVCLEDINGAVTIFEGRLNSWLKAHPVQGHLCHGMLSLQALTKSAIEQSRAQSEGEQKRPFTPTAATGLGITHRNHPGKVDFSSIQAFPTTGIVPPSPNLQTLAPSAVSVNGGSNAAASGHDAPLNLDLTGLAGGAPDAMALPHFWAEVFGVPVAPAEDANENPLVQVPPGAS